MEYEQGKAIPNQAILAKMERALGMYTVDVQRTCIILLCKGCTCVIYSTYQCTVHIDAVITDKK